MHSYMTIYYLVEEIFRFCSQAFGTVEIVKKKMLMTAVVFAVKIGYWNLKKSKYAKFTNLYKNKNKITGHGQYSFWKYFSARRK